MKPPPIVGVDLLRRGTVLAPRLEVEQVPFSHLCFGGGSMLAHLLLRLSLAFMLAEKLTPVTGFRKFFKKVRSLL